MQARKTRCFGTGKDYYEKYHDTEWSVPVHDDRLLFEMLILEGAQAGLSWETILKRRVGYQKAFHNFDPQKVSQMSDEELEAQCKTLKSSAIVSRCFLRVKMLLLF